MKLRLARDSLLAAFALLGASCVDAPAQSAGPEPTPAPGPAVAESPPSAAPDTSPVDAPPPPPTRALATFLVVADPSEQLSPEELTDRRHEVVAYLVEQHYIYSGDGLVQSAAEAEQIIRATLAPDGSFELSFYQPSHEAQREVSFDPAGQPEYEYFPGDVGYEGDGSHPFFTPMVPLFRPWRERDWDRRYRHDHGRNNDRSPRPPDHPTDRNHGPQPPLDHRTDDNRGHKPPPSDHKDDHPQPAHQLPPTGPQSNRGGQSLPSVPLPQPNPPGPKPTVSPDHQAHAGPPNPDQAQGNRGVPPHPAPVPPPPPVPAPTTFSPPPSSPPPKTFVPQNRPPPPPPPAPRTERSTPPPARGSDKGDPGDAGNKTPR